MQLATFTFPVKDNAGATVGLLSLPLRSEYFERMLLDLVRFGGSAAGIVDRNFKLVARIPGNREWQGKSVATLPGVAAGLKMAESAFETRGVDGKQRIVAQRAVPKSDWHVYVGVEEEVLFAGFRRHLMQGVAVLATVVAASLAIAYAIARGISLPLRDLVRVANAVAQGDRTARAVGSGSSEIGQLAEHVNRMLDSLEQSEASLLESNRRLHHLSGRILDAQEDERLRISRGLHDQIGQELTAVKIRLDAMAQSVNEPQHRARILDIANATGETLQRVRQISVDLRPPQLEVLGLAAALRVHVERQAEFGDTAIHFESDKLPRMAANLEIQCFRIAQEALTNVLRHSRAPNAWVRLSLEGESLVLKVSDDGRGFDPGAPGQRAPGQGGIGLIGMQERVALAGGALHIRALPGQGCTVTATFPLAGIAAAA
jgi:signal transduction histidine kinase